MNSSDSPPDESRSLRKKSVRRLACAGLALVAAAIGVVLFPPARYWLHCRRVRWKQRAALDRLEAASALPPGLRREGDIVWRLKDAAAMRLIPSGWFRMGDTENRDEGPPHAVYLSPYLIDAYEVTNRQFKQFLRACPRWRPEHVGVSWYLKSWKSGSYPPGRGDYPVHHVSWEAAKAYAVWAGAALPTEAQWEKAARGGLTGKQFPWGDKPDPRLANWGRPRWPHNQAGRPCEPEAFRGARFDNPGPSPVGSFPPNAYGLYDMAGNVWEWCEEYYHPRYHELAATVDPAGLPEIAVFEVLGWGLFVTAHSARGGSWYRRPSMCRCANRSYDHLVAPPIVELSDYYYGFRCVIPLRGSDGPSPDAR